MFMKKVFGFLVALVFLFGLNPVLAQDKKPAPKVKENYQVGFVVVDKNSDGSVTMQEMVEAFPGSGEKVFHRVDADKDGKITKEEWSVWQEREVKKGSGKAARKVKENYQVGFAVVDKNSDGSVTMQEMVETFPGSGEKVFHRVDADKDGKITKEEWVVWQEKERKPKPTRKPVK
jgi:Ca2+-binding EF-hand superfamily protein